MASDKRQLKTARLEAFEPIITLDTDINAAQADYGNAPESKAVMAYVANTIKTWTTVGADYVEGQFDGDSPVTPSEKVFCDQVTLNALIAEIKDKFGASVDISTSDDLQTMKRTTTIKLKNFAGTDISTDSVSTDIYATIGPSEVEDIFDAVMAPEL